MTTEHKPHPEPGWSDEMPRSAAFITYERPCEEALPKLAEAYNRLADEVERLWEREHERRMDAMEASERD